MKTLVEAVTSSSVLMMRRFLVIYLLPVCNIQRAETFNNELQSVGQCSQQLQIMLLAYIEVDKSRAKAVLGAISVRNCQSLSPGSFN